MPESHPSVTADPIPRATQPPLDRRLLRQSAPVRRAVGIAIVLGGVAALAVVAQAASLAHLLAAAWSSHGRTWPAADLVILLTAGAVRALTVLLGDPATHAAAAGAVEGLRAPMIDGVASGESWWRSSTTSGALLTLMTRGLDALGLYLARYLPALVLSVAAPIVVLGWIAWVDPWSALIIGVTVLVLPIFMVLLGVEASGRMRATWGATARLTGHFADVARGMRTLRSFDRAEAQVEVLERAGEDLRRLTMGTLRVALLSSFTLELLSSLATAIVALTLGLRLLGGHIGLTTALGVLLVTPEVYLPLRRASAQFHDATDGVGAAADLLDLLEQRPVRPMTATIRGRQLLDDLVAGRSPSIELVDVAVSHDGLPVWSAPLSLRVESGSVVNLLGASGAGKSSVLALFLGQLTPDSGVILIDDVPLAELDLMAWRQTIGWLPQSPTFPGATLIDVIRMRQPELPEDAVEHLLREIGLEHLTMGASGRRGLTAREAVRSLSTGERHRLAVLRAVLGAPRILLLDEPGAHLDPVSSAAVGQLLARRARGITTVLVSHEASNLAGDATSVEVTGWKRHHG